MINDKTDPPAQQESASSTRPPQQLRRRAGWPGPAPKVHDNRVVKEASPRLCRIDAVPSSLFVGEKTRCRACWEISLAGGHETVREFGEFGASNDLIFSSRKSEIRFLVQPREACRSSSLSLMALPLGNSVSRKSILKQNKNKSETGSLPAPRLCFRVKVTGKPCYWRR